MSYRVLPVLLCTTLASSAALKAEESGSAAVISAAFSNENYKQGLELVRQDFARLRADQSAEARILIRSILASVPKDEAGQTVVAAIQGNPGLGAAILNASVSNAPRDEQLVILSRLNFAASQNPESFSQVSQHVPSLLAAANATVPAKAVLTAPDYNPANSQSDTSVFRSPPDIKQDEKDIRKDERDINQDDHRLSNEREHLRDDIAQLIKDLRENKPPSVIKAEEAKINAEERAIVSSEKDLKADTKDLRADEKDLRQDGGGGGHQGQHQ